MPLLIGAAAFTRAGLILLAAALLVSPAPARATRGQPGVRPTVLADCLGRPVRAPSEIVLACGDGNESVGDLVWTGWGSTFAAGLGTASINDCTPTCVAGHDHLYPVLVLATGRETCRPSGRTAYAKVTIAFLDAKPHTSVSQTFPCRPFK